MSSRPPPNKDSTAASMPTKRYIVHATHTKRQGWQPKIHNGSGRTIFLIPIYGHDAARARSRKQVDTNKAIGITAGKSVNVNWKDYDRTQLNSSLQIYILFRAAHAVNFRDYIDDLSKNGVEVKDEEYIWPCTVLTEDLLLTCQEVVDRNVEQDIRKAVAPENLVDLIKNVLGQQEGLKKDIKALLDKMEFLTEAWKSFDQNQTKQH